MAQLRLMRGLTQEQLAEQLGIDVSTVRRWERGVTRPQPAMRRRLAEALDVPPEVLAAALDGEPVSLAPARRLLRDSPAPTGEDEVNRRRFLIGSAAAVGLGLAPRGIGSFGMPTASADTTLVEHLQRSWHALVAADNNLGPFHAIHGVLANVRLASDAMSGAKGIDRQRMLCLDAQFAESAAWLCEDLGEVAAASQWMQTASRWAELAGYRELVTWTLVGRARQALSRRDVDAALSLADQALAAQAFAPPAMRAAALCFRAEALAVRGDERLAQKALDRAEQTADAVEVDVDADASSGYGSCCTTAYVTSQRARCWEILGKPLRAIPLFTESLNATPSSYYRDRGWQLAGLSLAYAASGQSEEASRLGEHGLSIASAAGSQRIAHEVARVVDRLTLLGNVPAWSYMAEPE